MPVEFDTSEVATIARMEIQRSLGRVEGKLDQIISGMSLHENHDAQRFDEVNENLLRLDKRTSALEKKIWYGLGIGAVAVFGLSHIKDLIGYIKI